MASVRPLITALNASGKYPYVAPSGTVDYLVVGGGVVGLAVAQRLVHRWPERSTILVERHGMVGQETSSRNSEVIHAGLYYPETSLKTRLCLRGRHLLYSRCEAYQIPYKKVGKLVVGTASQISYLDDLHRHCLDLKNKHNLPHAPPTELMSGTRAKKMEPDLSPGIAAALWSPETGIVDSHTFMSSLEHEVDGSYSGDIVLNTKVVRVDPSPDDNGWVVQLHTKGDEPSAVLANTLINSTGLSSALILNSWLAKSGGKEDLVPLWFAKGSYMRYSGWGVKNVKHLLYPAPDLGGKSHGHAGLGVHLTLDLDGGVKFGPDVEWISPPEDAEDADFWNKHLEPSEGRKDEMYEAIRSYLPGVWKERLRGDYVGIRPKLVGPGAGFMDFVVRSDWSGEQKGPGRLVSLMGIESPGLTSSLGIAEMVVEEVLGEKGE
ncbi:pyridine nucleotide disulfide oxidoreductase-like protein [Calocera cornea HHB12733]|uniref:L-2-hydroxyglutarate dehydrogenase, mitochondrial n=1 Tax=Calocera cornea HHB12733 TaxID=1353952 RepID=A0A165EBQ7_9BASI|nr:pyridine nucleotide disulfide oxidoreductase-like protein [Calocera cornea HHB12733]